MSGARSAIWGVVLGLLLALHLASVAQASEPSSLVTLSGFGGRVTASASEHRATLALDGYAPMVFDNARVLVLRTRILVTARTRERTLLAWANRASGKGGIGLLVRGRDHRKHPQTFSVFVNRIGLGG